MDKWFEFGGVRGLIGAAIGVLQALIVAKVTVPTLSLGAQSLIFGADTGMMKVNATIIPSLASETATQPYGVALIIAIILGAFFTFVISGFIYWLGARIVESARWRVEGVWKAIASGIVGSLVIGIPVICLLYGAVMSSVVTIPGAEYVTQAFFATLIASIPVYVIAEAGFAAITWYIYNKMGWATPA